MRLIYHCLVLSWAIFVASTCVACGQNSDNTIDEKTAQAEFDTAIEKWRSQTKIASDAGVKFYSGTREESDAHREVWRQAVIAGEQHRTIVEQAALKLIKLSTKPSQELTTLLLHMHNSEVLNNHWHNANKIAAVLQPFLNNKDLFENEKAREVYLTNDVLAAISANEFDRAKKFYAQYQSLVQNMPERQFDLFANLESLIEKYEREKEFIAKDAAGEPLPRVVLKTTKGKIELELFENQAPDTVGNFVNLVEQGFYTNLTFHRVIANFMAQSGGFGLDKRSREPLYAIFDEYQSPDARKHFQGVFEHGECRRPRFWSSSVFYHALSATRTGWQAYGFRQSHFRSRHAGEYQPYAYCK